MALCGEWRSARCSSLAGSDGEPYQVLPQLDKYPPVRLEHLERPQRTSLVASLEDMFSFVLVVNRVPLVERCHVAVAVSVLQCVCLCVRSRAYSLMHSIRADATLPERSMAS